MATNNPVCLPEWLRHQAGQQLPNDRVLTFRPQAEADGHYHIYSPGRRDQHTRMLVLIHGISRQPRRLIESFRWLAEKHNLLLIAPLFSRKRHRHFQRLGLRQHEARADLRLHRILTEVGRTLAIDNRQFHLFGFSGGAQFAHRYALLHPRRLLSLSLGAAGWYSMPLAELSYPYGVGASKQLPQWHPELDAFLKVPCRVYVGADDIERDSSLNQTARIDRVQGKTRLERAARWVTAVNTLRDSDAAQNTTRLVVIANQGHDAASLLAKPQMQQALSDFIADHNPSHHDTAVHQPVQAWIGQRQVCRHLQRLHHSMRDTLRHCAAGPEPDDGWV